jgi:outer membrane protein W
MKKFAFAISLAVALVLGVGGEVKAENTKGRWHLGGGFSWVATEDDIRSNAGFVLFNQPGNDGVPDSGDEAIIFFDPRPDDTISRETTIEEGFQFDFNASYGVTPWFSLQVDAGYYEADVVQFDTYVREESFYRNPNDPTDVLFSEAEEDIFVFTQSQPITAGTITQIPISLTGVFRFRRDSPLNPYLGIGGGVIIANSSESDALHALDAKLANATMTLKGVPYNYLDFSLCSDPTCLPYKGIKLDVETGSEWHVTGGAEYFFNSNLSLYFDARYTFASSQVNIDVDGSDQTQFLFEATADKLIFCDDPSLDGSPFFPVGFDRGTDGLFPLPGQDGILGTPDDFPGCRPGTGTRLSDDILVQGGEISLSGLKVGVGIRWYF